ncbi:MAG TPA: hypothetical protein VJS38_19720 [Phenylobacterium sp.]|uniref:hypothetical protein n=1 Tax=Phenylobacterium sp. TaxID=1871053 RepID=UPI002B47497B|nr:hypothetical protein [Phenylobacterium sp.]HKR90403.1 hypothetical protein [Phenylobacterium sp.]
MFALAFLYPSAPGHVFDVEHWRNVHLPLGLGLTDKHLGVRPRRIMLLGPTWGGDLQRDGAQLGGIAIVMFDERKDVERFATLFEFQEAAERLGADFQNYTAGAPNILVADIHDVREIDEMIDRFKRQEAQAGQ